MSYKSKKSKTRKMAPKNMQSDIMPGETISLLEFQYMRMREF